MKLTIIDLNDADRKRIARCKDDIEKSRLRGWGLGLDVVRAMLCFYLENQVMCRLENLIVNKSKTGFERIRPFDDTFIAIDKNDRAERALKRYGLLEHCKEAKYAYIFDFGKQWSKYD